jgi:hypothetical protein
MTFVFSRYALAICLNNDRVIPSDSDTGKSYSRDEYRAFGRDVVDRGWPH